MKRRFYLVSALALLCACSGTKSPTDKASAPKADSATAIASAPVLSPEEQMLFSEVAEFVALGQESIQDSLWFQAGEDFDSALVRLSALEATDSLSPLVYSHAHNYRDSVQKLLIYTVAMTAQMSQPVPWTTQFNEEMEEVPDSSVKAMDSITHEIDPRNYELPLPSPLDQRVLQAMAVFMGPGRGYFTKWLTRKSRYADLVQRKLEERDMPKDLIYLAMVESGFNPKAWSKASASGMWQFISGTGRRYGLMDDWWYDPRRDPMLATDAALEYLDDLHDEFQDWHLAMAAYNCGEGKIRRLLAQDTSRGYWKMPLPQETRFYVPKILAAMIIGHNPERYGFKIENPESPLAFDTVTVNNCLTIATIAKSAGVGEDTVLALNPSLRRWCTPPNRVAHILYLPSGSRDTFCRNFALLDKTQLVTWRHHIVAKGENISAIAAKYRVSVAAIKATNKIKGTRLKKGQSLLIPLAPEDAGKYLEQDVAESPRASKFKGGTYRVRSGDNLFDIARRFNTTVSALLAANNMTRGTRIIAGQRLRLTGKSKADSYSDEPESHREPIVASTAIESREKPGRGAGARAPDDETRDGAEATDPGPGPNARAADPATGKFAVHTVQMGETLYSLTRTLGVDEDDLMQWNNLKGNRIQVGQKLKYTTAKAKTPDLSDEDAVEEKVALAGRGKDDRQYYVVKDGDSLWDISVKYRSTVQKIKDLNGKLPTILRPGTRIRVK
ncbi:MAG: LysM peptidoglycan-binding domain-containing protein [Fibrobacteria bacterium]